MNNCLVTKLKASVDNDSLPILGKIVIDLKSFTSPTSPNTSQMVYGSNVKVKPVGTSWSGASDGQEVVVNGSFNVDGNGGKLIVDAYGLTALRSAGCSDIRFMDSLKYSSLAAIETGQNGTLPASSLEKLIANAPDTLVYINTIMNSGEFLGETTIRDFLATHKNLVYFSQSAYDVVLSDFPNLKLIGSYVGNVENLPASIVSFGINANTSPTSGSMTNLVNKFRAAGRTNGKIFVRWLANSTRITMLDPSLGEVSCRTIGQRDGLTGNQNIYVTWDANSMSMTLDGTDMDALPSFSDYR